MARPRYEIQECNVKLGNDFRTFDAKCNKWRGKFVESFWWKKVGGRVGGVYGCGAFDLFGCFEVALGPVREGHWAA